MAVNQSQVDHIITAASEDDPEVKLQNLEREVDLIKTSIKRLLMDIRERMNELENPFTIAASFEGNAGGVNTEADDAKKSALEAREAALDARESHLDATKSKLDADQKSDIKNSKEKNTETENPSGSDDRRLLDDQMLAALKNQIIQQQKPGITIAQGQPSSPQITEKLRLQKVYKLFKWTHQSVKKYGHDRLEIMMESYKVMGYITKESCDEIKEISRLMPANLGEEHEVGPDEFVAELYSLNRILAPNDTSLDRDMIEVMMEQRQQGIPGKDKILDERIDMSNLVMQEKRSGSKNKEKDDEWMNLPDRI
jgi:hypothetical protein